MNVERKGRSSKKEEEGMLGEMKIWENFVLKTQKDSDSHFLWPSCGLILENE